jgi:hypothetical protein
MKQIAYEDDLYFNILEIKVLHMIKITWIFL